MRAGIDLDGVVHAWSPTVRRILLAKFGVDVGESETWDWIKDHSTPEMWKWLWSNEGIRSGQYLGPLYPDALLGLKKIAYDQDIIVITARPKAAIPNTLYWLGIHGIEAKEIHVLGHSEKKSAIPCDWYVDDKPENCIDLATTGKPVFLFDQKWNASFEAPGVKRVLSWYELLKAIPGTYSG